MRVLWQTGCNFFFFSTLTGKVGIGFICPLRKRARSKEDLIMSRSFWFCLYVFRPLTITVNM